MIFTINESKLTSKEKEFWICFLKLCFDLFFGIPIQEDMLCISVPLYYCWVWCHKLQRSFKNVQCRCSDRLELIYSPYSSLLGCKLGVLFFQVFSVFFPITWVPRGSVPGLLFFVSIEFFWLFVSTIQLLIFEATSKYSELPCYYISKNITIVFSNPNYKSMIF